MINRIIPQFNQVIIKNMSPRYNSIYRTITLLFCNIFSKQSTAIWSCCIYFFHKATCLKVSQAFWVPIGGTVTFIDLNVTENTQFNMGVWYIVNDHCNWMEFKPIMCKLCEVDYNAEENHQITQYPPSSYYKETFNHTCNLTSMYLYNITEQTPTTFKFVKKKYPIKRISIILT